MPERLRRAELPRLARRTATLAGARAHEQREVLERSDVGVVAGRRDPQHTELLLHVRRPPLADVPDVAFVHVDSLGECVEDELEAARCVEADAARAQSELLGSDVSLLLPLPGYEAIPPGTVLNHRMFFKHVADCQMGLFMGGLERFAQDPRFGAHRAHGCGRVSVGYEVKHLDGARAHSIGAVSIDPDRWDVDASSLDLSGEPERWLGAWHEGLE